MHSLRSFTHHIIKRLLSVISERASHSVSVTVRGHEGCALVVLAFI